MPRRSLGKGLVCGDHKSTCLVGEVFVAGSPPTPASCSFPVYESKNFMKTLNESKKNLWYHMRYPGPSWWADVKHQPSSAFGLGDLGDAVSLPSHLRLCVHRLNQYRFKALRQRGHAVSLAVKTPMSCVPHWRTWVQFPAPAPDASLLLMSIWEPAVMA